MDLRASSSEQSKERCSILVMKYKTYKKNIDTEDFSINKICGNYNDFLNWIISLEAIRVHETCYRCGAIMDIYRKEQENEIWYCTSGNKECETFRTDDKFCFDLNVPLPILITLLYSWYRNKNIEQLLSRKNIYVGNYDHLKKLLTEVCINRCSKGSKMIGGWKIRVNVEIGRKGGIVAPDNIVICGICEDDETQYFFVVLDNENPSYSEVRTRLASWLKPGSIVFTSSEDYEFTENFKWNKKNIWSLIVRSDCLARDLWVHIHKELKKPFERFVSDVLDYSRINMEQLLF